MGRWELDARGRIAGAKVEIVSTGLCNTSLGKLAIVFIDCCLHLLQQSIDRSQITTRFGIPHGWKAVTLHGIVAVVASNTTSNGGNRLIGWNG